MGSLPGVAVKGAVAGDRAATRTGWTQQDGTGAAKVIECKVVDLNLTLWTVDVISQFDQKQYLNIQIASPYMHPNTGEGIYAMPDLGAKCHVCEPSDSTPPFILDFIMPMETLPQVGDGDSPGPDSFQAAQEGDDSDSSSTFAGGRVRAKPGDIYIKGRNGNFVVLHRGGVLQVGASNLAQRIYIPLQNLITDISQNYKHHNAGGSVNWFLAAGESETNPPTIHKETYRLLAGDKKASIRIMTGMAKDVVREADSDVLLEQITLDLGEVGNDPVVFEVVLAPEAFGADSGSLESNTSKETKLRFFFDKAGGTFLRTESNVFLYTKRTLRVLAQDISFRAGGDVTIVADGLGDWRFNKALNISAKTIRMNGGKNPVAHQGASIEVFVPLLMLWGFPSIPGDPVKIPPIHPITGQPQVLRGTITSGNNTILV